MTSFLNVNALAFIVVVSVITIGVVNTWLLSVGVEPSSVNLITTFAVPDESVTLVLLGTMPGFTSATGTGTGYKTPYPYDTILLASMPALQAIAFIVVSLAIIMGEL